MSYEEYRSKPFEDIARADALLNPSDDDCGPSPAAINLAHALCALAQAKMIGRGYPA